MKTRLLGRSGIATSEIGYGSWAIGGSDWGAQVEDDSIAALHCALDLGCTFLDTALSYGAGTSERLIGRVLKERSERPVICTKVPPKTNFWSPPPQQTIDDVFPDEWITECCEQSLRNLGVECLDVLLLHTWSASWSHRTEWYETMERLRARGKIRAIGISIHDTLVGQANPHIEAGRVDVVEVVYNAFQQLPAYELFPLTLKHSVGVIARAPFQAGILTGKYSATTEFGKGDWRGEWSNPEWLPTNLAMLEKLRPAVEATGLSLPAFALKFALSHPAVAVTIPGGRNASQVRQNLAAAEAPDLPSSVVAELRDLWERGDVHGTWVGTSDLASDK